MATRKKTPKHNRSSRRQALRRISDPQTSPYFSTTFSKVCLVGYVLSRGTQDSNLVIFWVKPRYTPKPGYTHITGYISNTRVHTRLHPAHNTLPSTNHTLGFFSFLNGVTFINDSYIYFSTTPPSLASPPWERQEKKNISGRHPKRARKKNHRRRTLQ